MMQILFAVVSYATRFRDGSSHLQCRYVTVRLNRVYTFKAEAAGDGFTRKVQ